MKYLHINFILGIFALLSSCSGPDLREKPKCTWDDYIYQLTPFDLAYSSDFSDNFIMFTGGDMNSTINHLSDLHYVAYKGDADTNINQAKISLTQSPDPSVCYQSETNNPFSPYLIQPSDANQMSPDFYPYGKVFYHSLSAPLCNNAYSGETSISIQTDIFINYKTSQGSYYYLKWGTTKLADASNGTTLSDNIPMTENANIIYLSNRSGHASLIADDNNGYIYEHGIRIYL